MQEVGVCIVIIGFRDDGKRSNLQPSYNHSQSVPHARNIGEVDRLLTMDSHEPSDHPPDPPPSRMGADSKDDSQRRHRCHRRADHRQVSRSSPGDAEPFVLLVAVVGDTSREGAAFVVRPLEAGVLVAVWRRQHDLRAFAAGHEPVLRDELGLEDVGLDDEPVSEA